MPEPIETRYAIIRRRGADPWEYATRDGGSLLLYVDEGVAEQVRHELGTDYEYRVISVTISPVD